MLNLPEIEVDKPATATDLARAGLLQAGEGCRISPHAIFVPSDLLGTLRPIELGDRCVIGAGAVLHGGVKLGTEVHVEDYTIVGKPENGYAVREVYPGAGAATTIAAGVMLRAGAISTPRCRSARTPPSGTTPCCAATSRSARVANSRIT